MATTTSIQQGDVALHQTVDGGDIPIEDGIMGMCPGLEVAVYLSLFGGNEQDDGSDGNPNEYWGNLIETESSRHLRSRTQYLLRSLPITAANLLRIEEAVQLDLKWLTDDGLANSINVVVTIPALNTVRIDTAIETQGEEQNFTFTENLKASV